MCVNRLLGQRDLDSCTYRLFSPKPLLSLLCYDRNADRGLAEVLTGPSQPLSLVLNGAKKFGDLAKMTAEDL